MAGEISKQEALMSKETKGEQELAIKQFAPPGSTKFGLESIWAKVAHLQAVSRWTLAQQLAYQAWKSIRANPLTALLTLLTVSVVLMLFGAFVLMVQNVSVGVVNTPQSLVTLRLFMHDGAQESDIQKLRAEIVAQPGIKDGRFISKSAALEEYRKSLGDDASLLDGLEKENPLPASVEVRMDPTLIDAEGVDRFAAQFKVHRLVQHVQYSQSLVGQFAEFVRLLRFGGGIAIALMFAVTAFVVAVTIRLAFFAHRHEIQIMRLVGATPAFIRTPFLIEGVMEGLLGSISALAVLGAVYSAVEGAFSRSDVLSAFGIKLHFLSVGWIVALLIVGPLLGFIGSYLAVRRFSEE